jgi:anaerobic ribonucleoside-triphosphate reductase
MDNTSSRARILIQINIEKPGEKVNMSDKEKIVSALHLINGIKENVEKIVESVDKFFKNLLLEIEDWKFSMEEFSDGSRIFVRFQIVIKK